MRIGIGYDVHQLVDNRTLIVGGVTIPYEKGLLGHSDADVLLHAIMDAILGALGEGDIGKHFPDTEGQYKGASSLSLLKAVYSMMAEADYEIGNLDAVMIAQAPKMSPYIGLMKSKIAAVLHCDESCINLKATTTEHLGFEGRGEGIAAQAVVLLQNCAL
ncbi:2-C-methyl-D-erythritol 2,4-cyclodiphosphate synthase [Fusibacter paucivorans]|uniref:2-C-methyl-D-erythritol 2,4-cyclodiphosphate synthase n=1 Tax=Fusibacter paucivorans TaxID=76009 RepID=A0ABS5PV72_9FIRM|nr:2-C-methyl-D-erythritol 2,4-cyclodiphosphate synthase [Fusibacter paucivorans]MBS7528366.1 2-C-methyl-D-erythritol 2,4-cyclodiphosphate synthase [Fusibacter paucivorans]